MKTQYKQIDNIRTYVDELLKNERVSRAEYKKYKKVYARQGIPGEAVATVLSDGTVETKNVVSVDEKGNADWVVKNLSGEEYVVKYINFIKKYAPVEGCEGVYAPIGAPIVACQIFENVSFKAPWGEDMYIAAGGYLVISDPDDIYGIQEKEFYETYEQIK